LPAPLAARLAERAEELRPGALRLGQINGVGCYAVQDHGQRVVGALASQAACPSGYRDPILPDQKILVSIPGLSIEI